MKNSAHNLEVIYTILYTGYITTSIDFDVHWWHKNASFSQTIENFYERLQEIHSNV